MLFVLLDVTENNIYIPQIRHPPRPVKELHTI